MQKTVSRIERLEKQIRRAKKFAQINSAPVAELYLLHAAICEEKRDALRHKADRRRVTRTSHLP